MNLATLALIGLAGAGIYNGLKKSNKTNSIFDYVIIPINSLLNEYVSNSGLIVDIVGDDYIRINTPLKELYGLELAGYDNVPNYLSDDTIKEIFRDYKKFDDSYLFYCLHKQGKYQKQFLFSHNKNLLNSIATYYDLKFLSGQELLNAIFDLYLQNTYFEENKQLKRNITIDFENDLNPGFLSFKKVAKQAVYKNLSEIDIFQSYKALEGVSKTDIGKIFRKIDFDGCVWICFDFCQKRIENNISTLINLSKWSGNKQTFMSLKEQYVAGETDLLIVNSVALLKQYNSSSLGSLGTSLKNAYIPKDIFRNEVLRKTPLKYKDVDFDFLVDSNYFKSYIATLHKKNHNKPDIYGLDKNKSFVNYSFSGENNTPHMCIIAESGSGKSVSKQKIMAQMINLDFSSGYASELGKSVKIRSYDVGFSDEVFVELVKSNTKNNVAHISSDFSSFAYNLVGIDFSLSKEEIEADLVFATDLVSVILQSQNAEPLNINESVLFKTTIRKVYAEKLYQPYKVRYLKETNTKLYTRLLELGFDDNFELRALQDDEFEYLKRPLLGDIAKYCKIQSANQQIKQEDREAYSTLTMKLLSIEQLELFSRFDSIKIENTDFLSMDLNNFKESSLFTPIFLCIFQKTYLKDRDNALKCKRSGVQMPKLFYAIEEARNFFEVPYFETMLKKLAFEARKYNVHLCFIAQLPEHIPAGILKQLSTRIFLLIPLKKGETINEIKKYFNPPQKVIDSLNETEMHELCIWYANGVFNMKFEISEEEMRVFNTNPNLA